MTNKSWAAALSLSLLLAISAPSIAATPSGGVSRATGISTCAALLPTNGVGAITATSLRLCINTIWNSLLASLSNLSDLADPSAALSNLGALSPSGLLASAPLQSVISGATATLSITNGTSVLNPGTGTLEAVLPIQSFSGTSKSFGAADLFKLTGRLNSGSPMTDTFPPATTPGLINGTRIQIDNVDATASDTITAGAGTSIIGSGVVGPGRSSEWLYAGAITTWRPIANSLTAVLGPASATTGHVATFADGTGKVVQDGGALAAVATSGSASDLVAGTVAPARGGTGINNGSSTITLGGNLTTSGAHNTTITTTADSNSTLPAGPDTLAGLGTSQTFTGDQFFKSGRPWFDLVAWGGIGDGSTNNGPIATTMSNYYGSHFGSGLVYIPEANNGYCFTTTWAPTTLTRIVGATVANSIIDACHTDVTPIILSAGGSSIENLAVFGKGVDNDTGAFGAINSAIILATGCVGCKVINVQALGGLHAIELHEDDIFLLNSIFNEAYGSSVIYGDHGDWFIRDKVDQSWPCGEPAFPTTIGNWQVSTMYAHGTVVVDNSGIYLIQACTAGTSGLTPPPLKNYFVNIIDNTVRWFLVGRGTYYGIQLNTGAAENTILQTDLSGSYFAGLALTNTLSGAAPGLTKITDSTIGQGTIYGIYADAGYGLQVSGLEATGGIEPQGAAIATAGTWAGDTMIADSFLFGSDYGLIVMAGKNLVIGDSQISGAATSCIQVAANIGDFHIANNSLGSSTNKGACATAINIAAGTGDHFTISLNGINGATTGIVNGASGSNVFIGNNF